MGIGLLLNLQGARLHGKRYHPAKIIVLQIMQRDRQWKSHPLPNPVSLPRKSSIIISTCLSTRSIILRHFPCIVPLRVATNRSEIERGMSNKNAGKLPLVEKILAGNCFVTFDTYALSESTFTMPIFSVTLLALVGLLPKTLS